MRLNLLKIGRPPTDRQAALLVFLSALAAFAWVTHLFININTPHSRQSWNLTGDEPSYMLICQSIVMDRDVNLFNDASRGRKGSSFGCPSAGPHKARVDIPNGLVYSIHSPGLPLMLSPAFALAMKASVAPRYACALFLNLLAAAGVVLLCRLARHFGATAGVASAVALASSCSVPVLVYSSQIYPDLPAAVLVAAAFCALWIPRGEGAGREIALAAAAGCCAAWLPWLHIRLAVFSAGLALACAIEFRRRPASLAAAFAPMAVSCACLMFFYQRWYGSPWPNAAYIAQTGSAPVSAGARPVVKGLAGILFDGGRGLLFWAPFWLFVPAGLVMAARRRPLRTALLAAPSLAYLLAIASFDAWWGGFCPPNRFILPLLPLMVCAIAAFLADGRKIYRPVFAALALAAAFFAFRGAAIDLNDFYSGKHTLQSRPLAGSAKWFGAIAPDVRRLSDRNLSVLLAWAAAALWINLRVFFRWGCRPADAPPR